MDIKLSGGSILIPLLNMLVLCANFLISFKFKTFQGSQAVVDALTSQNKAKDEMIEDLQKSLEESKSQYHTLLLIFQKNQGELGVYRQQSKQNLQ